MILRFTPLLGLLASIGLGLWALFAPADATWTSPVLTGAVTGGLVCLALVGSMFSASRRRPAGDEPTLEERVSATPGALALILAICSEGFWAHGGICHGGLDDFTADSHGGAVDETALLRGIARGGSTIETSSSHRAEDRGNARGGVDDGALEVVRDARECDGRARRDVRRALAT